MGILNNLAIVRSIDRIAGNILIRLFFYYDRLFRHNQSMQSRDVKKILVIKFHGLGNLIMMMPTVLAIKNKYPGAEIDVLTLIGNQGLLEGYECIKTLNYIDNSTMPKFIGSLLRTTFALRKVSYDAVLDFEQFANVSTVLSFLICKYERIGFNTPGQNRGILYTKPIAYLDYLHMIGTFARLGKGLGVNDVETKLIPIPVSQSNFSSVDSILKEHNIGPGDRITVMHCGSSQNMEYRRWDHTKFAGLANLLINTYGMKVIFTGTNIEKELVGRIVELIDHKQSVVDAVQKLTIKDVAYLVTRSIFVVANDTSLVHIACAMGVPVVGFYGPNTPFLYGPHGGNNVVMYKDLYCSPCITNYNQKYSICDKPVCMDFTVEEVFRSIENVFFSADSRGTTDNDI